MNKIFVTFSQIFTILPPVFREGLLAESIEWFIDDQTLFSPPPPPQSRQ